MNCGLALRHGQNQTRVAVGVQVEAPSAVVQTGRATIQTTGAAPVHTNPRALAPTARRMSVADSRSINQATAICAPISDAAVLVFHRQAGHDGRYEVKEVLAAGGMGIVFRAIDSTTNCEVALKRPLFPGPAMIMDVLKSLNEAQAAALSHPAFVRSIDAGIDLDGAYIVFELVAGQFLDATIQQQGLLSSFQTARILRTLCSAIDSLHKLGMVHHDIKPGIVMVNDTGPVRVLDPGVARVILDQPTHESGRFVGTPGYASPEQCTDAASADHRTDIYALGVTAWVLLTGKPPGNIDPVALPPRWQALVFRATQADRELRYRNVLELMQDIDGAEPPAGTSTDFHCRACGSPGKPDETECRHCKLPTMSGCPACGVATRHGKPVCGTCGCSIGPASALRGQLDFADLALSCGALDLADKLFLDAGALAADPQSLGPIAAAGRNAHERRQEIARRRQNAQIRLGKAIEAERAGDPKAINQFYEAGRLDASLRGEYQKRVPVPTVGDRPLNVGKRPQQLTAADLARAEEAGDAAVVERYWIEQKQALTPAIHGFNPSAPALMNEVEQRHVASRKKVRAATLWGVSGFIGLGVLLGIKACTSTIFRQQSQPQQIERKDYKVPTAPTLPDPK